MLCWLGKRQHAAAQIRLPATPLPTSFRWPATTRAGKVSALWRPGKRRHAAAQIRLPSAHLTASSPLSLPQLAATRAAQLRRVLSLSYSNTASVRFAPSGCIAPSVATWRAALRHGCRADHTSLHHPKPTGIPQTILHLSPAPVLHPSAAPILHPSSTATNGPTFPNPVLAFSLRAAEVARLSSDCQFIVDRIGE